MSNLYKIFWILFSIGVIFVYGTIISAFLSLHFKAFKFAHLPIELFLKIIILFGLIGSIGFAGLIYFNWLRWS